MKLIPILALAGLSLLSSVTRADENNTNTTVEFVGSEEIGSSFMRPNFEYRLPFGVNGYTFFEVYKNGEYFGKTILNKNVGPNLNVNSEIIHGTDLHDRIEVGANYLLPMPKGSSFKLKVLPICFNGRGKFNKRNGNEDRIMAGYSGQVDLPFGLELSGFGEIKFAKEAEAEWSYGEIALGKKLDTKQGKFGAYYNPILRKHGKLLPHLEHAFSVSYKF